MLINIDDERQIVIVSMTVSEFKKLKGDGLLK